MKLNTVIRYIRKRITAANPSVIRDNIYISGVEETLERKSHCTSTSDKSRLIQLHSSVPLCILYFGKPAAPWILHVLRLISRTSIHASYIVLSEICGYSYVNHSTYSELILKAWKWF
jgi:hypothetical protein